MIIRLAAPTDANELKMLNDLFNGDDCNSFEGIATSLAHNCQEIVCVAEDNGALVGFCCGQLFKSMCYNQNYGEITELFVLERTRRKGVGRKLVALINCSQAIRMLPHRHSITHKDMKNLPKSCFGGGWAIAAGSNSKSKNIGIKSISQMRFWR